MRAVIQRVLRAYVTVEGRIVGQIAAGVVVLLAVRKEDAIADAAYLADKTANLRIFERAAHSPSHPQPASRSESVKASNKMEGSLLDTGGAALVVSQFTLYADVRRGRRPGFERAASPEVARPLYEEYLSRLRGLGIPVEAGLFQSHMTVELVNDGPITILLDSEKML